MSEETSTPKATNTSIYVKLMFLGLVVVGLTIPFHYVPYALKVFPKEQLTFSNTFITQQDVDYILHRYNNADNIFEQQSIASEPLFRKLAEQGIIRDADDFEEDDEVLSEIDAKVEDVRAELEELIDDSEEEVLSFEDFPPSVKSAFNDWEQYLIDNSIFDYVSDYDCDQFDEMMELYDNGKYPMHKDEVNIIPCNLNNDGYSDYLVSYQLTNCVEGNGWSRDFVFLTTSGNADTFTIDLALPNDIKTKFLDLSKELAPDDPYVQIVGDYIEAKGLSIESVLDGVIIGSFSFQADGPTCCPEIEGSFIYDINSKSFKTSMTD